MSPLYLISIAYTWNNCLCTIRRYSSDRRGSATNANYTSSCSVTCKDDDYLDRVEITDCMGRCTASGDTVTCIGETLYLRKKCNGHESSGPISEL